MEQVITITASETWNLERMLSTCKLSSTSRTSIPIRCPGNRLRQDRLSTLGALVACQRIVCGLLLSELAFRFDRPHDQNTDNDYRSAATDPSPRQSILLVFRLARGVLPLRVRSRTAKSRPREHYDKDKKTSRPSDTGPMPILRLIGNHGALLDDDLLLTGPRTAGGGVSTCPVPVSHSSLCPCTGAPCSSTSWIPTISP
jgi:hypothetical protein